MALLLEILTPDHAVFSAEVKEVTLPGVEGEMGVLAGHIPLATILRPGQLVAVLPDGVRKVFAIHSGFAEILPSHVIILTEAAEGADEIDVERAREALARAEREIADPNLFKGGDAVEQSTVLALHMAELERARARIKVFEAQGR